VEGEAATRPHRGRLYTLRRCVGHRAIPVSVKRFREGANCRSLVLTSYVHAFTSALTPAQFYRCGRAHATPLGPRMFVVMQRPGRLLEKLGAAGYILPLRGAPP